MNEKTDPKYWDKRVIDAKGDPQALVYADAVGFQKCTEAAEVFIKSFVRPGDTVLDAGCGYGRFFPEIAAVGGKYLGIDSSMEMINEAQRRFAQAKFAPISWHLFDISVMGLYDVVFECICRSSFDGTDDEFLALLMKYVKPGGILISIEPDTCSVKIKEGNIFQR